MALALVCPHDIATYPEILSCKVDFGTPYFIAACKIGVFSSVTDFIAASISLSIHCFRFCLHLSVFITASVDLVRGLPHFLLLLFGNKGIRDLAINQLPRNVAVPTSFAITC